MASGAMPPIVWTGTGRLGLSAAGIGGPSLVWNIDQIEAANENMTLDGGNYNRDVGDGVFNGTKTVYATDRGLNMNDPNATNHV